MPNTSAITSGHFNSSQLQRFSSGKKRVVREVRQRQKERKKKTEMCVCVCVWGGGGG